MRTFMDNTGRPWTVAINVDSIKRVKSLLGVDLMATVEGGLLEQLVGNPILLCDIVFALVKPEADAKNVTDEDFGRSMGGDAIDNATTAVLEDLVDFFPSRRRSLLQTALAKLRSMESAVIKRAEDRLNGPEMDKLMTDALNDLSSAGTQPGIVSGSAPESSV